MSQETANIYEEEEEDLSTDSGIVSDSSSEEHQEADQEIDFAAMSKEELEDFAKKEREAKQRAIDSLRRKEEKREAKKPTDAQKPEKKDEDIEERVSKIVELKLKETTKKQTIETISEGKQDWLKSQKWAESLFSGDKDSDALYVQVTKEAERLAEMKGITSKEGFQKQLRIAAASVLESPEPLIQEEYDSGVSTYQRQMSSRSTVSAKQPSKKFISQRQREIAIRSGHNPDEVYN